MLLRKRATCGIHSNQKMKIIYPPLVFLLTLMRCGQETKNNNNAGTAKVNSIGEIHAKTPIVLSESLEYTRKEFEQYVLAAQKRMQLFARQYPWDNLTTVHAAQLRCPVQISKRLPRQSPELGRWRREDEPVGDQEGT